ncbi:MAG: hypothetical protein P1S60_15305, partial [Anaerolineae bacterium]|nr:hypothetical protein [Anaerolineae bacterium]
MMKNKHKYFAGISISICLSILSVLAVYAVTLEPWFWASSVDNVSQSGDIRPFVALATEQDDVVAVWSGGTDAPGIYAARNTGSGWNRTTITATGNKATRFPALVLNGGIPLIAWSQSDSAYPSDSAEQQLLQQDDMNDPEVIADSLYGRIVPDMDKSDTGVHLVYPAATTASGWSKQNLYYTHRYLTETTWSTPTEVMTHGQVTPDADLGKIWYPKIAVSSDGLTLHVVWQQHEKYAGQAETKMIWYLTGEWKPTGVEWGTPIQISLQEQ